MPLLSISGVTIDFPKSPYKCQVDYMEHVIRALNGGANALLESPTGTGKTLCLLCATLAWQESKRGKPVELVYSAGSSLDGAGKAGNGKGMSYTIVYATRTHSQLAQVVSELRETSYRPRMTVMGSREQLCVHEKVSKLKSSVLNHACNSLNSKRGCMYRNNLDNYLESGASTDSTSVMDIEEMVKLGHNRKICPYFHSREFSTSSDLVLVPYNYLLDSSIRRTLKLDWDRCIVIFDEAHNLERVASDAASFSLSSTDLAQCIDEMKQVLTTLKDEQDRTKASDKSEADKTKLSVSVVPGGSNTTMGGVPKPTLLSAVNLLKAMFELEKRLDSLQLKPPQGQGVGLPGLVYPGNWLGQLLATCGLSNEQGVEELRRCCNMLLELAQDALAEDGGSGASGLAVEPKLQGFTVALDRVIRSLRTGRSEDYRVYIADELIKYNPGGYQQVSATGAPPPRMKRVVNYWCFSTGVAMAELQALGVKSMLLTSGTLSPMAALREDIKIPFTVQLENPHVISDNQIWVGSVSVGANGKALNSSYQNRDSAEYKDELGNSVLQICMTMVGRGEGAAPPATTATSVVKGWEAYGVTAARPVAPSAPPPPVRGGVLIFFPSYAAMESTCARWRDSGVYDRLRSAVGSVLTEPKGSGNATNSANNANSNGARRASTSTGSTATTAGFMVSGAKKTSKSLDDDEDGEGGGGAEFRSIVGQFEHAIKTYGGCVLLAVCRGKVSEGIDFTDNKGRVVIITGIPFAPYMDPWVMLKKQYLDEKCAAAARPPAPTTLPGTAAAVVGSADSAIVSSFHRHIAPSAYPAVMAPPPPPLANPVLPPAPAAYPPAPSAVVASQPAQKPAVVTLTGQNWYSQSAGRAVNQCIGRVIRHNRDWGTVFLLDDRFMNDRQIAQLSGWVKPRVKKYTSFTAAMKSFRSFLTTAAQDKTLVSRAMAEQLAQPQPDIERFRRREQDSLLQGGAAGFQRQVEIHASALEDTGEDNTFVPPSFLLSQQPQRPGSSASAARAPAERRDSEGDLLDIFHKSQSSAPVVSNLRRSESQLSQVSSSDKPSSGTGGVGLLSSLGRAREKPAAAATTALPTSSMADVVRASAASGPAVTVSYGAPTSSTAVNDDAKGKVPTGVSFGLGSTKSAPSFHVPEKVVRTKDSTIADYFAPHPASASSGQSASMSQRTQPKTQPQTQATIKRPALNIPKFDSAAGDAQSVPAAARSQQSQQQPQSFLSYLSQLDDDMHASQAADPLSEFHRNIDVLKGILSKDDMRKLKSKLLLLKSAAVSSTQDLARFLSDVRQLFTGMNSNIKAGALKSFICMVPAELHKSYLRLVEEEASLPRGKTSSASTTLGMKRESTETVSERNIQAHIRDVLMESRSRNEDDGMFSQSQTQYSQSLLDVKPEGAGGLRSMPSKRAKMMLSAAASVKKEAAPTTIGGAVMGVAQKAPLSQAKPTFLSQLSRLDDIALSGAVRAGNTGGGANVRDCKVGSSRLTCAVCKEKASVPCAGRCGHVCCQDCWVRWLKVNSSCPLCRAPASTASVTQIIIK